MDFNRTEGEGSGAPWAGLASTLAGFVALLSQLLCCVPGVNMFAWMVSAALTGACLLFGLVGLKQGALGGDVQAFSIVGLVLGALNAIILLIWLALQFGLLGLITLIIAGENP